MSIDRRTILKGLFACPACAAATGAMASGAHWSYEDAPQWGAHDEAAKACAVGSQQSPVDLSGAIPASLDAIKIVWKPQAYRVVNNGHTFQCDAAPGAGGMTIGKESYDLLQFHFHTPSEHALAGKRTEMEVHFVHRHASGRLAVVGVLMVAGKAHPGFSAIMATAPKEEGGADLAKPVDPASFLPKGRKFYRYEGSLTTPPCSEVVDWTVYEAPIEVAKADIATFQAAFKMNARPLQSMNRRFLLKGG
jgi:carbonic anhydrase